MRPWTPNNHRVSLEESQRGTHPGSLACRCAPTRPGPACVRGFGQLLPLDSGAWTRRGTDSTRPRAASREEPAVAPHSWPPRATASPSLQNPGNPVLGDGLTWQMSEHRGQWPWEGAGGSLKGSWQEQVPRWPVFSSSLFRGVRVQTCTAGSNGSVCIFLPVKLDPWEARPQRRRHPRSAGGEHTDGPLAESRAPSPACTTALQGQSAQRDGSRTLQKHQEEQQRRLVLSHRVTAVEPVATGRSSSMGSGLWDKGPWVPRGQPSPHANRAALLSPG